MDCLGSSLFFRGEKIYFDLNEIMPLSLVKENIKLPFVLEFKTKDSNHKNLLAREKKGEFFLVGGKDLFGHSGKIYFFWESDLSLEFEGFNINKILLHIDLSYLFKKWKEDKKLPNSFKTFLKIGEEQTKSQEIFIESIKK